ncbi:hypothetical protein [Streptomyces bullii]|uniref:PH domain-containing protein n=1 Tax=Streptomyces bullii TaxID=349910 RepID=A0ABW0UPG9_9ACTN
MTTNLPQPLRLPATALPDGCPSWDTEQARRWAEALPPRWVPVRLRSRHLDVVWLSVLATTPALAFAGLPPHVAALLPLHLLWLVTRPEVVRFSAPALVVVVVVQRLPWPVTVCAALVAFVALVLAELRVRARSAQRATALAAAGGVTAPLPKAGGPVRRGRGLAVAGVVLLLVGGALVAAQRFWDAAEDRRAAAAFGCLVVGLGLTVLVSAALGRCRATRLRAAPAPVLRVLMRDDAEGDTEVFAADDAEVLRPLFTVSVSEWSDDEDDDEDDDADDEGESDEDLPDEDEQPGPLREAVLYGAPCDGAEVLILSAAEEPDAPPVVEWSTGPVRPFSEREARRRAEEERQVAALEAVAAVRARTAGEDAVPVPVRSWRAGPVDWLASALMTLCAGWIFWSPTTDAGFPLWQQILAFAAILFVAGRLAVKLRWRITADRAGLWLNGGLRGPVLIPWDDLRSIRRDSFELKLRRRRGESWSVAAPRWAWLQRRLGLTHPYDALAAELTTLHLDPALRPGGESRKRERGRALWPLAVVLGGVWTAVVLAARWWA